MFISLYMIMEIFQVVFCIVRFSKIFDCTVDIILFKQGVEILFKIQGVVSDNLGGGYIGINVLG